MDTYCVQFGLILRHYRENKNYTREILAEMCDVSDRCISNIERGESEPKLRTIIKLCRICDIDIGILSTIAAEEETVMA